MMKSSTTRSGDLGRERAQSRLAVGRLIDLIALLREGFADEGADVRIVVDDQDALDRGLQSVRLILGIARRRMLAVAGRPPGKTG